MIGNTIAPCNLTSDVKHREQVPFGKLGDRFSVGGGISAQGDGAGHTALDRGGVMRREMLSGDGNIRKVGTNGGGSGIERLRYARQLELAAFARVPVIRLCHAPLAAEICGAAL